MSEELNVKGFDEEYASFVTGLVSEYSSADFNAMLGTMGLGLAGEAGEILEIMGRSEEEMMSQSSSTEWCGQISEENTHQLVLELGDILWYVAFGVRNVFEDWMGSFVPKDLPLPPPESESPIKGLAVNDLKRFGPPLAWACCGVADIAKKAMYHGKPWSPEVIEKCREKLVEIITMVGVIAHTVCGETLDGLAVKNTKKLSARYKSLNFSTEASLAKADEQATL